MVPSEVKCQVCHYCALVLKITVVLGTIHYKHYTPGRGKIVPRNYTPGMGKIVLRNVTLHSW